MKIVMVMRIHYHFWQMFDRARRTMELRATEHHDFYKSAPILGEIEARASLHEWALQDLESEITFMFSRL